MVFINSIRSIIRSRGKTALFTLLIFVLTLALALGVCVWASVEQFLADCDEYYTTIGIIEYVGTGYPDDTASDTYMADQLLSFDASSVINDEATLLWDISERSMGYIDGFWRTDTYAKDRMMSVFLVGNVFYNEAENVYNATVMKSLYSLKVKDDTVVYLDADFGSFEYGRYYLVYGELYFGRSPLMHLRVKEYGNAASANEGIPIPHVIDVTDGEYYSIPEDCILKKVADTLKVTCNSVLVNSTDDLMALFPFHQNELYFTSGRAFTEEEYADGSHVCVITEIMAARLGVEVGDTIDLSVAISSRPGVYNSYWTDDGFRYNESFTITGITNTSMDKSWYIYVPGSANVPSSSFPIGYTVGQATVSNDGAALFYEHISSGLEGRFRLTVYDQGYSAVEIPYSIILNVAKIVTAVCALVELAVLILFGFLFIYRQRETSETMLMLGTGRMKVSGYFFISASLISLIACAAGAVGAYFLHGGIIALISKAARTYALIDRRFSNGDLTVSRTLDFDPKLGLDLFMYVGLAVMVLAVLSCMVFAINTFFNNRPSRQKHSGPKKQRRSSHMRGGSMKYAMLSIFRGGMRSIVIPILAITVVVFFGQLSDTVLSYQEQLDEVYDTSVINGYFTDIKGKQTGNEIIDAYNICDLYHTGKISTLSVSVSESYYYIGISMLADKTIQDIGPLYVPSNYFVYESLEATILRGFDLTATNDIYMSPEFFYADAIGMDFLEGYDVSFLSAPYKEEDQRCCMVSTAFMEKYNVGLGDTVRCAIDSVTNSEKYNARIFVHYDMLVVGAYEKQGMEDTIYAPLSLFFDTSLIWGEGRTASGAPEETFDNGYIISDEQKDILKDNTFNSVYFKLFDTHELVELKDYLSDYGYSQVHRIGQVREFIVLLDAVFNDSVASVEQQIRYIDLLYPCLYALVGIIAVVVSYLFVISRKKELATMVALGTGPRGTFLSFFMEQSMLCSSGTVIGFLAWFIISGAPNMLHLILEAGFIVCYFLGSAISVTVMNKTNVMTIMSDRD